MSSLHEENCSDHHPVEGNDTEHAAIPLLSVADFNADGNVNLADIEDLLSRYNSIDGDNLYHPLIRSDR